jgi:glycosyltransferase involved in cell wall biosynthesis
MTFAYLILVHKNPGQLLRLVNALTTSDTWFFIHIDRKTDEAPFKSVLGERENVFFCEHRKDVVWAGFSIVEATMELIREMIVRINFPDYVHLLSGQDFPIKSNEYIFNYFEQNKGTNFIEIFPDFSNWKIVQSKWHVDELGYAKASELVKKQKTMHFLPDTVPCYGSQWWSLTGRCVADIFNRCNRGNDIYEFYRYTAFSDEMLFNTFLMNSEYKTTTVNYNLRKTEWTDHNGHPKTWTNADFDELIKSPRLFARKFDEETDKLVLDRLETYLAEHSDRDTANTQLPKPTVSVVMPVYNAEKYLKTAINSILSQTFTDFELIVVDDGSEDRSADIVKDYADKRIRLITMPHDFIDSLNRGISESRGKYIARMDADDIMMPERLEKQFEFMEKNPKTDLCGSWVKCFGEREKNITTASTHEDIASLLLISNVIVHPSVMMRRETVMKYTLQYRHDYPYAEDYKLWTDFVTAGCRTANISKILLHYHCEEQQVTQKYKREMDATAEKIKTEYMEYVINFIGKKNDVIWELIDNLNAVKGSGEIFPASFLQIIQVIYRDILLNGK